MLLFYRYCGIGLGEVPSKVPLKGTDDYVHPVLLSTATAVWSMC